MSKFRSISTINRRYSSIENSLERKSSSKNRKSASKINTLLKTARKEAAFGGRNDIIDSSHIYGLTNLKNSNEKLNMKQLMSQRKHIMGKSS